MFAEASFGKNDFKVSERSDFDDSDYGGAFGGVREKPLKYRDTISELYDDDEKQAVFNSSMKKGGALHGFNQRTIKGMSFNPNGSPNKENFNETIGGTNANA